MAIQNTNVGWLITITLYIYIYMFQGKYTMYGNKKHKDHKFLKYFQQGIFFELICVESDINVVYPLTNVKRQIKLFTYFGNR